MGVDCLTVSEHNSLDVGVVGLVVGEAFDHQRVEEGRDVPAAVGVRPGLQLGAHAEGEAVAVEAERHGVRRGERPLFALVHPCRRIGPGEDGRGVRRHRGVEGEGVGGADEADVAGAVRDGKVGRGEGGLADAEAMIKSVLAKHKDCVVAETIPGKNGKSPIDLDPKTGEVLVNVRVRIDQAKYTQFANEVVEKISPMATKKIKVRATGEGDEGYNPDGEISYHYDLKAYPFLIMTSLRTGSATAFQLEKNVFNAIKSCLDTGSIAVAATLYDAQGVEIAESSIALSKDRIAEHGSDELSMFAWTEDFGCIMPFYTGESSRSSDNWRMWGKRDGRLSSGTYQIPLGKFSPEELKSVGKLEIKVGHMKGNQFFE